MNTKLKSNSVIATTIEGSLLTIAVLGKEPIRFDAAGCSNANNDYAMMHGWKQRLCDTAAIGADPKASVEQRAEAKYRAIRELAEYYLSGDVPWKQVSSGGGDGGMLLTALCRLRPNKTMQECADFLDSRTAEQLRVVKAIPEVIALMNQIRVERAPKMDTGGALDALDDSTASTDDEIADLMREESAAE